MTRRRATPAQRQAAVDRVRRLRASQGGNAPWTVARELDVSYSTILRWCRASKEEHMPDTEPLRVGDVVHGYAQGLFGRDHYGCARVEAIGADWVIARDVRDATDVSAALSPDAPRVLATARDERCDDCCDYR